MDRGYEQKMRHKAEVPWLRMLLVYTQSFLVHRYSRLLYKEAPDMNDDKPTWLQQWGIAVLRVGTGIVFLLGGVHKLFIHGFSGTAESVGGHLGSSLAVPVAVVVLLVEPVCGMGLVLGLFTRLVSVPLAAGMLVDVLLIHPPSSFFGALENDASTESAMIRLVASSALILTGPGKAALSRLLL